MNKFKTVKKFIALVMAILMAFSGVSVYAAENAGTDNESRGIELVHEHIYGDWIVSIQPTCQTAGEKYRECINCNSGKETEVMPADPNAHVPGDEKVIKSATCVASGISEYTCKMSGCGTTYQVETAKYGHTLEKDENGNVIVNVSIAPKHMYKYYSNGRGYSNCIRCGLSVEQTLFVEHDFDGATPDIKSPATCTEDGYMETKCNVCEYFIKEDIPADPDAHVFSGKAQLKEGTVFNCKIDGIGVVVCEKCNATDEITIPKEKAHDYLEWKTDKELPANPICGDYGDRGSEIRYCDICSTEVERRIIYAPHNFTEYDKDGNEISHITGRVASTCCTRGYDVGNCVDCGQKDVKNYHDVDPDAHNYIEKVTKKSSCIEKGELLKLCKYDASHFEYSEIELADHVYDGTWDIKEATCTEPGYKKNHCAVCGDVNIVLEIDKDAHDFSGQTWTVTEPAYCGKTGKKAAACKRCGETITQTLSMCYSVGAGFKTTEPTCYKEGKETYTCTKCGKDYEVKIPKDESAHVPAIGYVVRRDSTCTETGLETKYCAYCNADITENQKIIPTKPHTVKEIIDVYPQCAIDVNNFKKGSKHYECVDCTHVSGSVEIDARHNYTSWDNKGTPSCEYAITRERLCYGCGHVDVDNNFYGEHADVKWTFENGKTCTTGGIAVKRCTVCKDVYDQKTIAAGDHTDLVFVSDKVAQTDSICYGNVYKCVTCSTEIVVSRPHNFMLLKKGYEPTCTLTGLTDSKYCAVCKLKIEQMPIKELGHDKAYDSNGTEYCTRCNLYNVESDIPGKDTCDHFCHNQGIVAKVLKMLSGFFWKLFKINHFCECGTPHYHEDDATIELKEINKKGQYVCEYSCTECEVKNKEITLK